MLPPSQPSIEGLQVLPRQPDSVIPESYWTAEDDWSKQKATHVTLPLLDQRQTCHEMSYDGNGAILLLILVLSAPTSKDLRRTTRNTWGAPYNIPYVKTPLVFLMGYPEDMTTQEDIEIEADIYQDIVQYAFVDTYANSTLKTIQALSWAAEYCESARYVGIMRDTVVIDTYKLVAYLQSLEKQHIQRQVVMCYLYPCCMMVEPLDNKERDMEVKIISENKSDYYFKNNNDYTGTAYPAHCSESIYIVSGSVVRSLRNVAYSTPQFQPVEAWIGVLAEKLGLVLAAMSRSYSGMNAESPSLIADFNSSSYTSSPIMTGILNREFPGKESIAMLTIWNAILLHHQSSSELPNPVRFMSLPMSENDQHVYSIAAVALLIDLFVMCIIGYVIFRNRKRISKRKGYYMNT